MKQQNSIIRTAIVYLIDAFDRAAFYLDKATQFVATVGITALFLSVMLQIIMRYIFGIPLFWSGELAGYLLALIALWGMSSCVRHSIHVRVTLVQDTSFLPLRHGLAIVGNAVVIYYASLLFLFGLEFARRGIGEYSPSTVFEIFWPRMIMVTGAGFTVLQALNLLIREIAAWIGLIESPDPC